MIKVLKVLTWLVVVHSLVFLAFWLTNAAFKTETNDFLAGMLGARLDYLLYCLLFSAGLTAWGILRLIFRGRGDQPARWPARLGEGLFILLGVIYLAFFYGSFMLLFKESPAQKTRALQLIDYYRVILDPLILAGMGLLVTAWIQKAKLARRWVFLLVAGLVILWSLALAFPPGSVLRGALPDKPLLIAHRGADALAPENTLAAVRLAAELGAYGQETDVQMSADGQLFLMHDDTLDRTTNVENIFPGREKDKAGSFTWAELNRLDAGSWFGRGDPFGTIRDRQVSQEDLGRYMIEPIPTFAEWLGVLKDSGQTFLYDVKSTGDDPQGTLVAYEATLQAIKDAGLAGQAWILAAPGQIELVENILPDAKLAFGIGAGEEAAVGGLLGAGYQVVNAEYTLPVRALREYQQAGLWINIYTADEPWQFYRLWILGVDSVTTNHLAGFMDTSRPVLAVPYLVYATLLALAAAVVIVIGRFCRLG